jgi:hypothetical protein
MRVANLPLVPRPFGRGAVQHQRVAGIAFVVPRLTIPLPTVSATVLFREVYLPT